MRACSHTGFSILVVSVDFIPLAGLAFVLSFCGLNLIAIIPALLAADSAIAFHSRIMRMRDFDRRIAINAEKFAASVRALCLNAAYRFRLLSLALVVVPYFTGKSCAATVVGAIVTAFMGVRLADRVP